MRTITRNLDLLLINSPLRNYDHSPRINDFTLPTLGLAYIATCCEEEGLSVDVLDAEALGLGLSKIISLVNEAQPRWVGLNLLAPTYRLSVALLSDLNPTIRVMLGGHHAKAMPSEILSDRRIPRIDALVIGEGETRVPALLQSIDRRGELPLIYWREGDTPIMPMVHTDDTRWLAPDIDQLPMVDRKFLANDPYEDRRGVESAVVGSRGCPFNCSFCGAAVSSNPDITIRMRAPSNIISELAALKSQLGVQRVRFVDDLFLANPRAMSLTLSAFVAERAELAWDATGRINVLARAPASLIELMKAAGCGEVALGIETGSDRLLSHIDKKITVEQIEKVVLRLCTVGIDVKGYFILGLPTETRFEHDQTRLLIERLWETTARMPGNFRCSAFEYRPYPGTPDWRRLVAAGYSVDKMLDYEPDLREDLYDPSVSPDRDEFNFSTGLQFGEVPVSEIRRNLSEIMRQQHSI